MTMTNLKTVTTKTATVASAKLTTPADRIGLGFGAALAYPADILSLGQFPTPHNLEPEQLQSRQDGSDGAQMRKQMRTGEPDAVPPTGPVGCPTPGSSADRVTWSVTVGESWRVAPTDTSRSRDPKACVRLCPDRDCQSPVQSDEKRALVREAASAAAVGK